MQRGPNQPLKWTGLLKASCSGIQFLPATQGQRYVTVHVLSCSLIRPQSSQGFWLSTACDTAAFALRVLSGRDLAGG